MATYQIDPAHTVVEFSVKHMMFSTVKGRFGSVSGTIEFDEGNPAQSSVQAQVSTASVDTHEPTRDQHLRSPDFFDAETYPQITFVSRRVEPNGQDGKASVVGDLTIRDVTREVSFETAYLGKGIDPWGKARVGFSASTTVNRRDFGLHWNVALEAGGVLVGDSVTINLEVQAVEQS